MSLTYNVTLVGWNGMEWNGSGNGNGNGWENVKPIQEEEEEDDDDDDDDDDEKPIIQC